MKCFAPAATIAMLLAVSPSAFAVEPALQPRHAVLVLRNRQVLEGDVTPAGDYYLVALGKTGQVRLAAADVEMVCRDLQEAYQRKAAAIEGKSAAAHLELADWCLRHSLFDAAKAQIDVVRQLEPAHRGLRGIEKRLEFATTPPKTMAAPSKRSTATVGADQLNRTMKELPPGTVEHFTAVVQPILMDRCGAAKCHGSTTTAQFQLLQPLPGKVPSRRFTQRNLFATLAAVNKELPDDSRLLEMARKPHGHIETVAFKSDDDRQYREIKQWVHSLRAVPQSSPPATVNTAQIGTLRPQIGSPGIGIPMERKSSESGGSTHDNSTISRDPFDPAIFNERYHPAR